MRSFFFSIFLKFRSFVSSKFFNSLVSLALTLFLSLPHSPSHSNHPFTVNGTSKTTSVRNMDAREVAAAAALLRGSAGRKATVRAPARRHLPSEATSGGVQGGWRPGLAEEMMERELAKREA